MLLGILPELETYKKRITLLKEENKFLQTSLQHSQPEIEDLKYDVNDANFKQEQTNNSSERIEHELKELQFADMLNSNASHRGKMNFFGIKEREKNLTATPSSP